MHRHQLRPALHAVLVLLLAGTAPRAARAQDAPARSGAAPTAGTLIVELHGQEPATFAVAYTPASTAGELLARIAKHVGVSPDYLVVYTATGPSVDAAGRVVHRRASKRVGGYAPLPGGSAGVPPHLVGANTKLLSDLGIKDGDVLITYLRPLRGDHIHYAFAIYVGDLLVDTLWDTSVSVCGVAAASGSAGVRRSQLCQKGSGPSHTAWRRGCLAQGCSTTCSGARQGLPLPGAAPHPMPAAAHTRRPPLCPPRRCWACLSAQRARRGRSRSKTCPKALTITTSRQPSLTLASTRGSLTGGCIRARCASWRALGNRCLLAAAAAAAAALRLRLVRSIACMHA